MRYYANIHWQYSTGYRARWTVVGWESDPVLTRRQDIFSATGVYILYQLLLCSIYFRKPSVYYILLYLNAEMTQIIAIHPRGRQGPVYFAYPRLLITRRRNVPRYRQSWFWSDYHRIFRLQHHKGQNTKIPSLKHLSFAISFSFWLMDISQICVSKMLLFHEKFAAVSDALHRCDGWFMS